MDRRIYDQYVFQIAENGSLTRAAAALGISQPALSSGLTALEKEVGIRIFNRRSVPITFTPEGELYYEYISRLKVLTGDFEKRLESYREDGNRRVSVGGPVAYVESIVADAVVRLRKINPQYRITVKASPLSELIAMASAGELDCFISTSDTIPENFEKVLIRQEKIYVCIPAENPLNDGLSEYRVSLGENGKLFDFSLLNEESFVFLEENQPLQQRILEFLTENGIEPKSSVTVNQVSTALNLSLKGEGICFASEEALECRQDLNRICLYSMPDFVSKRKIYVAYEKTLFQSEACRTLIGLMTGKASQG